MAKAPESPPEPIDFGHRKPGPVGRCPSVFGHRLKGDSGASATPGAVCFNVGACVGTYELRGCLNCGFHILIHPFTTSRLHNVKSFQESRLYQVYFERQEI